MIFLMSGSHLVCFTGSGDLPGAAVVFSAGTVADLVHEVHTYCLKRYPGRPFDVEVCAGLDEGDVFRKEDGAPVVSFTIQPVRRPPETPDSAGIADGTGT